MLDVALSWGALAIIVGSTVVWFAKARAVVLEGSRAPFVLAWAAGALAGFAALLGSPGWAGGPAAGLAVLAGLVLLGMVAVSPQAVATDAIRVGERLRDFTAPDEHGEMFSLSGLEGRPILLKFFRGHW